ncbi:MAG: hypothetical protein GY857_05905 [Desulfobacula sp.]|nr:hypothetical protein [Desulfobacula sp.]
MLEIKFFSDKTYKYKLICCLVIWFLICSVGYLIVSYIENSKKTKLTQKGIVFSKNIASEAGLPLLEKNSKLLSQLLARVSKQPEVIYASIIDHKNKTIAFTDQDQFLLLNQKKSKKKDGVFFWKISNINNNSTIHFSTDITFSGTKIGEVFISLTDSNNIHVLKRWFFWFAFFTLLPVSIYFLYAMRRKFFYFSGKLGEKYQENINIVNIQADYSDINCPLCGTTNKFSNNSFSDIDLVKTPILIPFLENKNNLYIKDVSKTGELNWLKKRIILQCTEIINRIAS